MYYYTNIKFGLHSTTFCIKALVKKLFKNISFMYDPKSVSLTSPADFRTSYFRFLAIFRRNQTYQKFEVVLHRRLSV
jgi:hypothetical protein